MKLLFILLFSFKAYSFFEVSGNYSYSQQIYGTSDSSTVSQSGTASISFYPWRFVGLEFFGTQGRDKIINNESVSDGTVTIVSDKQVVYTSSYGAGLKIIFGTREQRILPSIGFGYSKQYQQTSSNLVYNSGSGDVTVPESKGEKLEIDSSYASVNIRIRLIHTLGLTLGARTIVPKNKWSDAERNFTFTGGLSWFI